MSSTDIVKSVSKKLKYYFQVKRLEDGFDLSSADCPRLDHPPVKARPTLNYSGLHDRPLKHYFNDPEVKVALTQFKVPEAKKSREQQMKRAVQHNVRKYQFVPPHLVGAYYAPPRRGSTRRTHPGLTGFGNPPRKQKSNMRAGYPVLRSVPPRQISRGEAQRLINMATKLLVATETTIDLGEDSPGSRKQKRSSSAKERGKGAPRPFESLPPLEEEKRGKKKGRARSAQVRRKYQDPDSAYDSPTDASSPTGDSNERGEVPNWLRKQMQKVELQDNESGTENQWVRPHSGYSNVPRPPSEGRPRSASTRTRSDSEDSTTSAKSSVSSARENAEVQTGGELLKKYDPMDQVVDGEKSNFRIHVHTGNKLGASTRAEVRLILYGDKGRTQEIFLSDSRNHKIKFQKGQEDIFDIDAPNVGPVRKIDIGHDKREISFGWYLDKVHVKDRGANMQYFVQCDRWLSSREGDGRTFKDFPVTETMSYNPGPNDEPEDFSPVKVDRPQIKYETAESTAGGDDDRSIQGKTDTSSHTSLNTLYSERADQKKQRRDSTSSSSSYTSASSSSGSSQQNWGPLQMSDSDDSAGHTPRPKTVQPLTPTTPVRKDDFFDQKPAGKDYSSVLDSLSTTTDQDNKNDFDNEKPGLRSKQPSNKGPTLKSAESTEDSRQVHGGKPSDTEDEPPRPKTSLGQRDPPEKQTDDSSEDSDSSSSSGSSEESSDTQKVSIHRAAKAGDLTTVRQLIEKDSGLKTSTDEKGWQPLHTSSAAGHVDIVKWLAVNNINLDEVTPTGYTALHLAAMNGQTNTLIVLAALGAKIDLKSVDHQTPLHLAAMSGHLGSVKFLVENLANVKEADNLGRMPVDLADEYQHQDVADFLKGNEPTAQKKDDRSSSDSEIDSEDERKKPPPQTNDPELMEKRRLYAEQQQKQSKNVSFLDSIHNDYDSDN